MTSSILSDKRFSPESDIALEATHLIQKMVRHILLQNCQHCRHILQGNDNKNKEGPEPEPESPGPIEKATQHTQQPSQEMKYYNE